MIAFENKLILSLTEPEKSDYPSYSVVAHIFNGVPKLDSVSVYASLLPT